MYEFVRDVNLNMRNEACKLTLLFGFISVMKMGMLGSIIVKSLSLPPEI